MTHRIQFHSRYTEPPSQPQIGNGWKATDAQSLGVCANNKQVSFRVKRNGTYRLNVLQRCYRHEPRLAAWFINTLHQSPHTACNRKIFTLCPVQSISPTKQPNTKWIS